MIRNIIIHNPINCVNGWAQSISPPELISYRDADKLCELHQDIWEPREHRYGVK